MQSHGATSPSSPWHSPFPWLTGVRLRQRRRLARLSASACPLGAVACIANVASTEFALWTGALLYGSLLIYGRHAWLAVKVLEAVASITCCCLALVNVGVVVQ